MLVCTSGEAFLKKPHWLDQCSNEESFWSHMSQDFTIECNEQNPCVQKHIRWYQQHPKHLAQILKGSEPFIHYVYQQTQRYNLPAELALIPLIESQYNPAIGARSGAAGLWQMMPGTATKFGLKINKTYDGRRDVSASTKAALAYLSYLYRYFNQNWLLALAAYESGEGRIASIAGRRHADFWNLPLAKHTKDYVPKLLAIAYIIKQPHIYNLRLPHINNQSSLQEFTWNEAKSFNLEQAAKNLGIDDNTLRYFNPGIRKNIATVPGSLTLLVPQSCLPNSRNESTEVVGLDLPTAQNSVAENEQQNETTTIPVPIAKKKPISKSSIHYKVKQHDTLLSIAKHFHVTVAELQKSNHLTSTQLKIGKQLLIPQPLHSKSKTTKMSKHKSSKTKHRTSSHGKSHLSPKKHTKKIGSSH